MLGEFNCRSPACRYELNLEAEPREPSDFVIQHGQKKIWMQLDLMKDPSSTVSTTQIPIACKFETNDKKLKKQFDRSDKGVYFWDLTKELIKFTGKYCYVVAFNS